MPVPGPAALGRGVVVADGGSVPPAWSGAPVVRIDEAVLAAPAEVIERLHRAWAGREAVVVALAVDAGRFRRPEAVEAEPWTLSPRFELWLDRLHFLVWANTYDARKGEPVWWWARKAVRLGATEGGGADVVLPDGRPAWIDGGPRGPVDLDVDLDAGIDAGVAVVHAETVDLGRLTAVPAGPDRATASAADGAGPGGIGQLAPDQEAAVRHGAGPARVVAPAGSGKTRVLTERLRHLVVERGMDPETLLAVAYNKKAQEELETRSAAVGARVRTLNALGYSLLGRGLGHAPRLLGEREVRRLVEDIVPPRPRRSNTDPIAPYLEALSLVRMALRDPQEVEAERDDVPGLADAFPRFRQALASSGAIDFDEQIYGTIQLLLADGDFRRRAQAGCNHLLVDEFQDLTPAHVLLLRILATPQLDVFGVGDDDQVIYGHAGADPGFLIDFGTYFPAAASYPLEVNYRCPVAVVGAARTLLGYNRRRVAKEIRPGPEARAGDQRLLIHEPAAGEAAAEVTRTVTGWLAEPGMVASRVAVLARVNSLLLAPHVALAAAGVPLDSVLRPEVLDRTGVRAALAYLRIASAPEAIAGADVVEVLRRPTRGLPQWFPDRLRRRARWTLATLRAIGETVPDKDAAKVDHLVDDLEMVVRAAARSGTTLQVLRVIKDGVGLGRAMGLLDGPRGGEGASHLDDLEALEQVAALHPDPAGFEAWLRASFQRQGDAGGVTLSTVHRVKGMEWDRVVVFGVTEGILPHRLAADEEEERRILHVAITRGIEEVVVVGDAARPSPFLAELTGRAPRLLASTRSAPSAAPPPRKARPADADAPLSPPEAQREEALRAWRKARAKADQVPAFVVFQDLALRAMARARPTSLEALARISGVGPTKLELYGEDILAVLESVADSADSSSSGVDAGARQTKSRHT